MIENMELMINSFKFDDKKHRNLYSQSVTLFGRKWNLRFFTYWNAIKKVYLCGNWTDHGMQTDSCYMQDNCTQNYSRCKIILAMLFRVLMKTAFTATHSIDIKFYLISKKNFNLWNTQEILISMLVDIIINMKQKRSKFDVDFLMCSNKSKQ